MRQPSGTNSPKAFAESTARRVNPRRKTKDTVKRRQRAAGALGGPKGHACGDCRVISGGWIKKLEAWRQRSASLPSVRTFRPYKTKAATARGLHLYPFRTEKLNPAAPMVLRKRESR